MTTQRFSRTMQEAFGPYTNNTIYERVEEETLLERVLVTVSFCVCVGVIFAMWWIF